MSKSKRYRDLTEQEIVEYYRQHNLDVSALYCKGCGKFLIYDGASVHIQTRKGKYRDTHKGELVGYGNTFLKTKVFGDQIFHLCKCKDCIAEKFPDIHNVRFLFALKAAKYVQYAFDVPDEVFKKYSKSRQSVTKEKMIVKYGEATGLQKWNEYCQKQAYTNSFEYKHEKYGMTREQFDEYNKSRAVTKDLCIQRHGEIDGLKIWNDYCERQRYTTSLQYFIEIYGKDEGIEKYRQYESERRRKSSNMANDFFDTLTDDQLFAGHEIYYERFNYEFDVNGYKLDFYDKTINVVIEFNGDLWHANPEIYHADDYIRNVFDSSDVKVSDIWKKDEKRKSDIIDKLHCRFFVIWEKDYIANLDLSVQKMKQSIFAFS